MDRFNGAKTMTGVFGSFPKCSQKSSSLRTFGTCVFFLERMSTLIFVLCGSVVFTQSEQGSHPMFVLCGIHIAVGLSAKTKRTIEGMADGGFSLVGLLLGRPCEMADRTQQVAMEPKSKNWSRSDPGLNSGCAIAIHALFGAQKSIIRATVRANQC